MAKPICCQEVGECLARHGMPAWRIERVTDELAEHWEELHRMALERGSAPHEAVIEANQRLGRPECLASEIIAGLRRSSWLGRHPLIGVCIAPLILPMLLMAAIAGPLIALDQWIHFLLWIGDGKRPEGHLVVMGVWALYYFGTIVSVTWLCRRAWLSGLGVRWVLALCAWGSLMLLIRYVIADPIGRHVSIGVAFPARLNGHVLILLLVHLLIAARFLFATRSLRKKSAESAESTESPLEPCVS